MDRRKFVGAAGLAGAAGLLSACGQQNSAATAEGQSDSSKKFEWKMVTAWPKNFPGLGVGANQLAESIGKLTNGRLTIKVFGAGELVPAFEVFDAVANGTAELGHSASYYWKGKAPAAQFFSGVPFGMSAQELHSWIYYGGGLELWQEVYKPHGLIPFLAGSTGAQMGGWFNREINSLDDLKGLNMRIPGLGGEILKRAGGTPQAIPGGEVFTALETGVIDAAEWVGPYNDQAFGLFQAAKYYYYPGWQEPGSGLECMINEAAWNELPTDLQDIVKSACQANTQAMLADFTFNNGVALNSLLTKHDVQLRRFPDEVLHLLKDISTQLYDEMASGDAVIARIYESYNQFQKTVGPWTDISDRALLNLRPEFTP